MRSPAHPTDVQIFNGDGKMDLAVADLGDQQRQPRFDNAMKTLFRAPKVDSKTSANGKD